MKKHVSLILVSLITLFSFAQSSVLPISTDKTTILVFPAPIKHLDLGSKDILAQTTSGSDNILLVKAGIKDFGETNLTVVVEDNTVYSFEVRYEAAPNIWVYHVIPLTPTIENYAKGILDNGRILHGVRVSKDGISSTLKGIYVRDDIIYYHLDLQNSSSIDYDIDLVKLSIRNKSKSKRTATQEIELTPSMIVGGTKKMAAMTHFPMVIAAPRITLQKGKYLAIDLSEKNGGRHLLLKINNRKILKAVILPNRN